MARGEIDLASYAQRDGQWRVLGLSAPARRALVNAGLTEVGQLAEWTRGGLAVLHGMGPSTLTRLEGILAERGMSFHQ